MSQRTEALAQRLEKGAHALAAFAMRLTDQEWQLPVPHDGRTFGVVVHHVATRFPLDVDLALQLAAGKAIEGVTEETLAAENAVHARHFADVDKPTTLNLLRRNSAAAAAVVRTLGDTELDRAGRVSFCGNAHLTCQFVLEDRVVRHSYHHLARMIMTLTRTAGTVLAA